MIRHSDLIPHFIKAKSAKGLRRLMFKTNAQAGMQFQYFDIQFVNGSWFAWYFSDLKSIGEL